MNILRVALLAATTLQLVSPLPVQAPRQHSIGGVVISAGDATPIPAAHVALWQDSGTLHALTTDSGGRFVFPAVAPGTYVLKYAAAGFLYLGDEEPGPFPYGGKRVRVTADGGVSNVVLELTPTASVTGSVRDGTGKPLSRIPVHLIRSVYNNTGKKDLEIAKQVMTNDRGEYRIFWITPGRYYVSAGGFPSSALPLSENESSRNSVSMTYGRMFFPNIRDAAGATLLNMVPGSAMTGTDFTLSRLGRYRIRGRVIDATGRPTPALRGEAGSGFRIDPASTTLAGTDPTPVWRGGTADGTFEIVNVPSGEYRISVNEATRGASAIVTVLESDLDGVVLTLRAEQSLNGRVEMDNGLPPKDWISIYLIGSDQQTAYSPLAKPDTFSVAVQPGSYRLAVFYPYFYLKEAWLGDTDVSQRPLTAEDTNRAPLRLVLGRPSASLQGTVRDQKSEPVAYATVVAVPDPQKDRADLYRNVRADADGRYDLRFIPPGNYKVYAWRRLENYSWLDPAVLAEYENQGVSVHVEEPSQTPTDLRAIPSVTRP